MGEESHPASASSKVIGLTIEVHRHLGPGPLESAYEDCLAFEFREHAIVFRRQVALPVVYKGMKLDSSYRINFNVPLPRDGIKRMVF